MEGNQRVLLPGLLVLISVIYAAHSVSVSFDSSNVAEHCKEGKVIPSTYVPRGTEYEIGNLTVYESPNRSAKRLVIAVYDIFGTQNKNINEVVDMLAEMYDFRVVLPDFYRGFPWDQHDFPPADQSQFDRWLETNASWDIAKWDVYTVMNHFATRENISEVAIWGTCWGGLISLRAASEISEIKAAGLVHPSWVEITDAYGVRSPMYLMPAMDDPDMLPFYEVLKRNFGDNSGHRRFDDMYHGFVSSRGDFSDPLNMQRVEEVIDILGTFFNRNFGQ